MKAANRREEYSWPKTTVEGFHITPERKRYRVDEIVAVSLAFRVVGGLRESFIPDLWTVAWEENDKLVRLTMNASVSVVRAGIVPKRVAGTGKEVRKAKFYWSRDPDLPYRIWSAIILEDGSAPVIPVSVEDAKAKFLDIDKRLEIPAKDLGEGRHSVVGSVALSWGRRMHLEKGSASARSKGVEVVVE